MRAFRYHMAVLSGTVESLGRFWRDRKGTGAIEFAIIAPLLIMAYIGSFEISVGFNLARKISRASSTIADVLTQQSSVDKETLDGMKEVAEGVMSPFEVTDYTLKMTGIKVTAPGSGVVAWSRDEHGGTPYQPGSTVTFPTDISSVNTFIVRSELVVPHQLLLFAPDLLDSTFKTINISKTSYFRQRIGDEIDCTDCS